MYTSLVLWLSCIESKGVHINAGNASNSNDTISFGVDLDLLTLLIASSFSRLDTLVSLAFNGDKPLFFRDLKKNPIDPLSLRYSKHELTATVSSIPRRFNNLLGLDALKHELDLVYESPKSAFNSDEGIVRVGKLIMLAILLTVKLSPFVDKFLLSWH